MSAKTRFAAQKKLRGGAALASFSNRNSNSDIFSTVENKCPRFLASAAGVNSAPLTC
eukprot:c44674_g1_i1 orf=35-205(+)